MAAPQAQRDRKYSICFGNHASAPDFDMATVGTLDSLATTLLPTETKVTMSSNANAIRSPRANGVRGQIATSSQNNINAVIPTITIEMPFTFEVGDFFIGACMQEVVETASGIYKKVFTFPLLYAGVPDFAANAGAFFTLIEDNTVAGSDAIAATCIVKELTLSWSKGAHDGRLWMSMQCEARYMTQVATYDGTLTYPSAWTYANWNDLATVTFMGGTIGIYEFSLTMKNNLIWTPLPNAGTYNATNAALPKFEASGMLKGEFTDLGSKKAQTDTDNLSAFVLSNSSVDPIVANNKILIKGQLQPNKQDSNSNADENTILQFDFDCIGTGTGSSISTQPLEIQMANTLSRVGTWTTGFWA